MAFLTRSLARPVVATQRVVKRRDFERLVFADATVSLAKTEAAAILEEARLQAADIAEAARQQGLSEGQAAMATQLAALAARQHELLQASLPLMAKLVGEALSSIATDIDQEQRIDQAMQRLRQQLQGVAWLRLQVAPGKAAATRRALDESEVVKATGLLADVTENPSISDDEFVLETDLGFATARVSEQVDLLRQVCVAALEHGARVLAANSDARSSIGDDA